MNKIFEEIESTNFTIQTGIASVLQHFKKIVLLNEAAQQLSRENQCEEILNRILDISRRNIDNNYENPYDTALATYLLILKEKNRALAEKGAVIVSTVNNLFWAGKIAEEILSVKYSILYSKPT